MSICFKFFCLKLRGGAKKPVRLQVDWKDLSSRPRAICINVQISRCGKQKYESVRRYKSASDGFWRMPLKKSEHLRSKAQDFFQ